MLWLKISTHHLQPESLPSSQHYLTPELTHYLVLHFGYKVDGVLRIKQPGAAGASTQLVELTRNVNKMIKRHWGGKNSSREEFKFEKVTEE